MSKKILSRLGAAAILIASYSHSASPAAQATPEIILFGGKIVTVDRNFSYAQAIAIADGKILAVGGNQGIRKLAGPATRQINLGGKMVIPGLADNHLHSAGGGPGVDLSRVRTMTELM